MNKRPAAAFGRLSLCLACLLLLLAAAPVPLTRLITAATAATNVLRARLGRAYAPLMRQAKAILIAPKPGTGAVLLLRNRQGWSEPAFLSAEALPQHPPAFLLIMSDRALDAILRQRGLNLTGPGALTVAPLASHTQAELLSWPAVTLDESGPRQDDAANAAWYGHARGAAEILGSTPSSARTAPLRQALTTR